MKTSVHLMASLAMAALFFPEFGWQASVIIAGGVLIDIDHYFWYVYKHRKFSIVKSYYYFLKNIEINDFTNVYGLLLIFHTVEFLIAMIILSFYSKYALLFTLGLLLHYLLDLIFLYAVVKRFVADHSIIHWAYVNLIQKV